MTDSSLRKLFVFLCNVEGDMQVVRELWNKLGQEPGLELWWNEEDLMPGDDSLSETQDAVKKADVILLFVSSRSLEKNGLLKRELRDVLELAHEKNRGSYLVTPVILEQNCPIPYYLRALIPLYYFSDATKSVGYSKLLKSFLKVNRQIDVSKDSVREIPRNTPPGISTEPQTNVDIKILSKEKFISNIRRPAEYVEQFSSYGWATCKNPGLLIYIVDSSRSMGDLLLGKSKLEFISDLMSITLTEIVRYSREGDLTLPTYRVGVFAYAEDVKSVYGKDTTNFYDQLKRLDELPGIPHLEISNEGTDTAKAFAHVATLLDQILEDIQESPAPIICHITDGDYTGNDPQPFAQKLMSTGTKYGNTLLLNILLAENMLSKPIIDVSKWNGIRKSTDVSQRYAKKLMRMSSEIPVEYVRKLKEKGYSMEMRAKLLFPVETLEIASKIFAMPSKLFGR